MRSHLKFQLEYYLTQLSEIINNESIRPQYETRELALDNLLQLCRIPGFTAELYINYDCDLYSTNIFEDLSQLLSKNSLSATQVIYSIHTLSIDILLTIVESIEKNCQLAKSRPSKGQVLEYSNEELTDIVIQLKHSRTNSNADSLQVETDGITSGNESSVFVENINNYLQHNTSKLNQFDSIVTQEQLLNIKNKKRVSVIYFNVS